MRSALEAPRRSPAHSRPPRSESGATALCPSNVAMGHQWTFSLFNDLVGAREYGLRDFETEGLGCPEVKHQLEFRGLDDR